MFLERNQRAWTLAISEMHKERKEPDVVDFIVPDAPEETEKTSSHPEWNDDGADESIPDEMFHQIFKFLHLETCINMRLVCKRFHKIIAEPWHKLREGNFSWLRHGDFYFEDHSNEGNNAWLHSLGTTGTIDLFNCRATYDGILNHKFLFHVVPAKTTTPDKEKKTKNTLPIVVQEDNDDDDPIVVSDEEMDSLGYPISVSSESSLTEPLPVRDDSPRLWQIHFTPPATMHAPFMLTIDFGLYPLDCRILALAARAPSCFTRLRLDTEPAKNTKSCYMTSSLDPTFNMARIAQLMARHDDNDVALVETQRLIQGIFRCTEHHYTRETGRYIEKFFRSLSLDGLACLPTENADVLTQESLKCHVALHPYQLYLIDWMARLERKILLGQPVAKMDFYLRSPSLLRGTPLAWDFLPGLSGSSDNTLFPLVNQDTVNQKDRPTVDMYTRGGFVADEPGLGKTRAIIAFFLGVNELDALSECDYLRLHSDPTTAASGSSPPKDRLLLTKALNYGRFTLHGPQNLLYTRAGLIVCRNSLVGQWLGEAKAAYPHKKIVLLTTKTEHEKLTYADIATADLVIVSTQFLMNRNYYITLRYGKESLEGRVLNIPKLESLHTQMLNRFYIKYLVDPINKTKKAFKTLPKETCPFLDVFAWPRVAIDEIHEHIRSRPGPSPAIYRMGLPFYSTRSMWLVSATHSDSLNDENTFVDWNLTSLLTCGTTLGRPNPPSHWMDLGPRGFQTSLFMAVETQSLGALEPTKDKEWKKDFVLNGKPVQLSRHVCSWVTSAMVGRLMQAIFWRNTKRNTEQFTRTPPMQYVTVPVPLHPWIAYLSEHTHFDHHGRERVLDLPLEQKTTAAIQYADRNSSRRDTDSAALPLSTYAAVTNQLLTGLNRTRVALEATIAALEFGKPHELFSPELTTHEARTQQMGLLAQRTGELVILEAHQTRLQEILTVLREVPFFSKTERRYGTKVYMLLKYLRRVFKRQPKAQVVIGTCYAKALITLLQKKLRKQNRSVVRLGGMNVMSTQKNLALFQSGQAQVAIIDANQTASGLNLQNAHYIFILDENMSADTLTQLVSRLERQGNKKQPVTLRFKADTTMLAWISDL